MHIMVTLRGRPMGQRLTLSAIVVAVIVAASQACAQSAPTIIFSYDEMQQVLTVSLSNGDPFPLIFGQDQIGNGTAGCVGDCTTGVQTWASDPGQWGDGVGSEWLITNDQAGYSMPPCPTGTSFPNYTGDPEVDFASCIAAIKADGGTYEIGHISGAVTPEPGTPTGLIFYARYGVEVRRRRTICGGGCRQMVRAACIRHRSQDDQERV